MSERINIPLGPEIDWTQVVFAALHTGEPTGGATPVPVRLESVKHEGTIAESHTYVPVEPTVVQSGETFTFVEVADTD